MNFITNNDAKLQSIVQISKFIMENSSFYTAERIFTTAE